MPTEAEQRAGVVREALTWLRTPYHHHARIKAVGVDCALLLAEVFERRGLAPHIEPGNYPRDWHLNHTTELFEQWLEAAGAHRVERPGIGDVGLWKFGHTRSHGSIVVAEDLQVVHAYLGMGVVLTRPTEAPLAGREVAWWSLFGEAA